VRLGTCIALELAVAATALGGVAFCVTRAADLAGEYLGAPEAQAATLPTASPMPEVLPRAHLPHAIPEPPNNVFGTRDADLMAPIVGKVTKVKLNLGGTSLSLRLDFESGARAAFKPEQKHLQSDPRREIAAYRIDRLLEIGHVPPAKAITVPFSEIVGAIEPGHRRFITNRLDDEALARNGIIHGEASWWIPEIRHARLGKLLIDEREGRMLWMSYLQIGATIPEEARSLVEQIAAVVLFDSLIDNADRWSGNNTMMSPDGKILYFMDNTMAFSLARVGHDINVSILRRMQVFPRALVGRIRKLTEASVTSVLTRDDDDGKLGKLLTPQELKAIMHRRDRMLEHIDQVIATYGEDAVLALP
jgi:hypothetical protein